MIKLRDIILNENNIFVPRRSREERTKTWRAAIYKQIQAYIRDGNKGDLNLSDTPIERLPDNLKRVGGSLHLQNTKITSLPDDLHVGGGLYLSYTPITSLPNNLRVGGNLYLANTPLAHKYTKDQIKAMVPHVRGGIYTT